MKFLFLGVAVLVSTSLFGANFAMDQGSIKFGGSAYINFSYNSDQDYVALGASFNPHICYFLTQGLCAGGAVRPFFNIHLNDSYNYYGLKFSPEVRYYIGEKDQQMYPFAGLAPYFGISKWSNSYSSTNYNYGFYLIGGLAYMISKAIALEPHIYINYDREKITNHGTYTYSLLTIGFGVDIATFWY